MKMTSKKTDESVVIEKKQTTFVTADMVLDVFIAAEKESSKTRKKEILDNAVFLSQHLNEYIPLKKSQYIIQ
jgi:hypothetical protein